MFRTATNLVLDKVREVRRRERRENESWRALGEHALALLGAGEFRTDPPSPQKSSSSKNREPIQILAHRLGEPQNRCLEIEGKSRLTSRLCNRDGFFPNCYFVAK